MFLHSQDITDGNPIDIKFAELGAGGQNIRPQLSWGDLPAETQSLAITCYDPDAPTGSGWWHWIAFNIPVSCTELPQTKPDANGRHNSSSLPEGSTEWSSDYGYLGYGGPCPPPGPAHRYIFKLHALDVPRLELAENMPQAAVRFNIFAHTIATAEFIGLYQN